jgi:hypothetical protein
LRNVSCDRAEAPRLAERRDSELGETPGHQVVRLPDGGKESAEDPSACGRSDRDAVAIDSFRPIRVAFFLMFAYNSRSAVFFAV